MRFSLVVLGYADGSAEVHGVIVLGDEPAPGVAAVLVAEPVGGLARCADTDGDGTGGLVQVEATFRDVRAGTLVPVVITTSAEDLDARGPYELLMQIGADSVTVLARVTVGVAGPPARR